MDPHLCLVRRLFSSSSSKLLPPGAEVLACKRKQGPIRVGARSADAGLGCMCRHEAWAAKTKVGRTTSWRGASVRTLSEAAALHDVVVVVKGESLPEAEGGRTAILEGAALAWSRWGPPAMPGAAGRWAGAGGWPARARRPECCSIMIRVIRPTDAV